MIAARAFAAIATRVVARVTGAYHGAAGIVTSAVAAAARCQAGCIDNAR